MRQVSGKWRPPLALVIGGTLAGVLCLPLIAIGYLKIAGDVLGWREMAFVFGWMAIFATCILGFLLWRLVLRPVYALTSHARAVREGRGDVAPPQQFGTPEFSELGRSVIDMGKTLQSRAASLRAYADHVTHELKSPLTAISGAAELLQSDLSDADRLALAGTIADASARMEHLLDDLRRHAAATQAGGSGSAVLSEVARAIQAGDLKVEIGQDGTLPLPAGDLTVVLTQLAKNADEHGARQLLLNWSGEVLSVNDDGTGIADGNQARVFDPFFTTRRDIGGTGMGLSIVATLLSARGARIELVPTPKGTLFEITF